MNETARRAAHLPAENLGAEEVAGQVTERTAFHSASDKVSIAPGTQHSRRVDQNAA